MFTNSYYKSWPPVLYIPSDWSLYCASEVFTVISVLISTHSSCTMYSMAVVFLIFFIFLFLFIYFYPKLATSLSTQKAAETQSVL